MVAEGGRWGVNLQPAGTLHAPDPRKPCKRRERPRGVLRPLCTDGDWGMAGAGLISPATNLILTVRATENAMVDDSSRTRPGERYSVWGIACGKAPLFFFSVSGYQVIQSYQPRLHLLPTYLPNTLLPIMYCIYYCVGFCTTYYK